MNNDFTEKEKALFHAIYLGSCKDVKHLLKEGADPSIADPTSGVLPIHLAARYGNMEIITRLLSDERVKADSVDRRGKVPYEWAEEFNHTKAEILLVNEIVQHPTRYGDQAILEARHHIKLKDEEPR